MFSVLSITSAFFPVTDITVDPAGITWVATGGGLLAVDEDGVVLTTDARVRGLDQVEVQDGHVWVLRGTDWRMYDEGRDTWSGPNEGTFGVPVGDVGEHDGPSRGSTIWDAQGRRIASVPGTVAEEVSNGANRLVRTVEGELFVVGARGVDPVDRPGACGNFVTGLTRWNGDLVVGTFDQGACVLRDETWASISLPSTMVNEVLSVPSPQGDVLWIATAEGLVRVSEGGESEVFLAVEDGLGREAPGLNHAGANHLSWDGSALWVVDVLGPVRIEERDGHRKWNRYRWSVSGHSYQTIAACGKSVWAGSEDDGLAVRGVNIGSPNGRSDWRHVNALDGLPEDWVMATACAGERAAWVGTYQRGVGRVDSRGWHSVVGLEAAWVQTVVAHGAVLWVGAADGVFRVEDGVVEQVSAEDTWAILVEEGRVIIGTRTGIITLESEEDAYGSSF